MYGDVDSFTPAGIKAGVYAYSTSGRVTKELAYWITGFGSIFRLGRTLVCGRVKMWGEVIEHEEGYRAEYAKVIALDAIVWEAADHPAPVDLDELRIRYLDLGGERGDAK